jgi:hypothetical protein
VSVDAVSWVLRGGPDGGALPIAICTGDEVGERSVRLVLLVVAEHANRDHLAWPAVATIARESGQPARLVKRCLRVLERGGQLSVVVRGGGRNRPTCYRLAVRKGDSTDTVSGAGKGVAYDTVSPRERVSPATERVSPAVIKGVVGDTRTLEPKEPRARDDEYMPGITFDEHGWMVPTAQENHLP